MATKQASPGLRQVFSEELAEDSNATLADARNHLRDIYDRGPEGPEVSQVRDLLSETELLVKSHHEHTSLTEFVG